jgi:RND family efflux transporter MFP subunit
MTNHAETRPNWLIPAAAVGGLLLVILIALGVIGGPEQIEPGTSVPVGTALPAHARTYRVQAQMQANTVAWQGTVRSRNEVNVAPKLDARIAELRVRSGDTVKKGDVLVRLDDRDGQAAYQAALAAHQAAAAQAEQAQTELRRISELLDKQAATQQNYDAVAAQAKAARAVAAQTAGAAQQAKVALGENQLYAPFDGVVGSRRKDPGDMVQPNETILSVYQPQALRLEVAVPSPCLSRVALGDTADVRFDGVDGVLHGQIDEIAPELDAQTHTQMLKLRLPAGQTLRQGQFGWLDLSCQGNQSMLLIPAASVLYYGQLQAVNVVEQDRVLTRHIRTGKAFGDQLEVLSGLRDGETILVNNGL